MSKYSKKHSAKAIAQKALKLANDNKNKIEVDYAEFTGAVFMDDLPSDIVLNQLGQGDEVGQRQGDTIHCISLNGWVNASQSVNLTANMYRLVLIWDKYNKVNPSSGFMSQNGLYCPIAHFDQSERKEFFVLWDSGPVPMTGNQVRKVHKISTKLNKDTHYDGNVSTVTKGMLRLVYMSDAPDAGPTNDKPVLTYDFLLRYTR